MRENSLKTKTKFNAGQYPVVDRNGKPFTPECRVRFRVPTYFINTVSGEGTMMSIDEYGGCTMLSDVSLGIRDRNGAEVGRRRELYSPMAEYKYDGPHAKKRVTVRSLGDPHEHGTTECFIEVVKGR